MNLTIVKAAYLQHYSMALYITGDQHISLFY